MPTSNPEGRVRARRNLLGALLATLFGARQGPLQAQQGVELRVWAAGSLRAALTEIAAAFEAAEPGTRVKLSFGASGLLKDRLTAGERADVFASANMEHPQMLVDAGLSQGEVRRFALNRLCALVSPVLAVAPDGLIDAMLDPAVRLGTSTPKADPSGDYAWAMFERIEQQPGRAGAYRTLTGKALQLTGGPASPKPPGGGNVYGQLVAGGAADIFLAYCTNARVAVSERPALRVLDIPETINVGASYGVITLAGAPLAGRRFVDFLLGPVGQARLARYGFGAPT